MAAEQQNQSRGPEGVYTGVSGQAEGMGRGEKLLSVSQTKEKAAGEGQQSRWCGKAPSISAPAGAGQRSCERGAFVHIVVTGCGSCRGQLGQSQRGGLPRKYGPSLLETRLRGFLCSSQCKIRRFAKGDIFSWTEVSERKTESTLSFVHGQFTPSDTSEGDQEREAGLGLPGPEAPWGITSLHWVDHLTAPTVLPLSSLCFLIINTEVLF